MKNEQTINFSVDANQIPGFVDVVTNALARIEALEVRVVQLETRALSNKNITASINSGNMTVNQARETVGLSPINHPAANLKLISEQCD